MSGAPKEPRDELAELLWLYCSEDIDVVRLARLQKLVAADPQALAHFVEYMQIHGGLEWAFRHQYAAAAETIPGSAGG